MRMKGLSAARAFTIRCTLVHMVHFDVFFGEACSNMPHAVGEHFVSGGADDQRVLVWALRKEEVAQPRRATQQHFAGTGAADAGARFQLLQPVRKQLPAWVQQPKTPSGKHVNDHRPPETTTMSCLLTRLDLITSTLANLEQRLKATEARLWPVDKRHAQVAPYVSCMC